MTDGAMQLRDDAGSQRYVGVVDGVELAHLDYRDREGVRVLLHTEVEPQARGRGVAEAFVRELLDELRAQGRRVGVRCPYVTKFLARHPEYRDVVLA